jgi:hypothetical protein
MYPNRPDILVGIPTRGNVTLVKLGKGGTIIADGCSTARKHRRLLKSRIIELACEGGISDCKINIFEGDCWQHMRNIWFGAVIKHLSGWLEKHLAFDLEKIPYIYRVSTSIDNLLRCIEKEVAKTANYAKGHGAFFDHYKKTFNPGVYHFLVARALGGSRQDIGVEGAVPIMLMNLKYYLEFLDWRLTCAVNDNLLQTSLYITLHSVEMVALLQVLSILHIAVCMPVRWLARNTEHLAQYDFGSVSMGRT